LLIGLEVRLGGPTPSMEADSDRRRSDLPRAHPFGLHDRAAQQPVVHTDFLRMAIRAGLGRIKRSVVAGSGIESR